MKHKRGYYDVFVRTCANYPSNIAVRYYINGIYKTYTYSELYGVCEYISQILQQLNCNKGTVGLLSVRNILVPCAIAAVHKCSKTFIFLDPTQEVKSQDARCKIIISIESENMWNQFSKKPDKTITVFGININFYKFDVMDPHHCTNDHLNSHSFIARTSGSTGHPKHIIVPIQCLQPNIDDLTRIFKITSDDVIYFSTPLTFDPSMIEILLACMNGASLLIAPEQMNALFPDTRENSITFWQTTPSKFLQFSNTDIKNHILSGSSTLKILALGGEPLNNIRLLKELKSKNNQTRIYSLYGVTEMSCWACVAEIDLDKIQCDKEIPLGNCLSETKISIEPVNKDNKNIGKILLMSKTRKTITLNKSTGEEENSAMNIVDTGDIAEIRNSTIYYIGRTDDMIKRFGHKINLQYIETVIMQCPKVKSCSCIWIEKPMLLVVYFSSQDFSSKQLSDFLKCKLDDKHWPDKILRVESIPINTHGKTCKKTLSNMFRQDLDKPEIDNLKIMLLKELNLVLSEEYTYDQIKDRTFLSLGGSSFLAVAMCNKLSLSYPIFAKVLLPYLLMNKNTFNQIITISKKEMLLKNKKTKCSALSGETLRDWVPAKRGKTKNDIQLTVVWTQDTGKCVDASPVLIESACNPYVTVGSHSGVVIVAESLTGEIKAKILLNSRVEASILCCQLNPDSVQYCVVGTYDGTIICFTGPHWQEIWRNNVGAMIKSKAAWWDNVVFVATYNGHVHCIHIKTGEIKKTLELFEHPISADLVIGQHTYILAASLSGACKSIIAHSGVTAWHCTLGSPVFAAPVLYHEETYVLFAEVRGVLHCRTVNSGLEMWKYEDAKGHIFSSLYVKNIDKTSWQMAFGCHDNNVYSIQVRNHQPSLKWKCELPSPVYSTPCALNEKLILSISDDGTLHVIEFETGNLLANYSLPGKVFSSPVIYKNYIFVGCRNDHLYCIKILWNK